MHTAATSASSSRDKNTKKKPLPDLHSTTAPSTPSLTLKTAGVSLWLNSLLSPHDPLYSYLHRQIPSTRPATMVSGLSLYWQYKWTRDSVYSAAIQKGKERRHQQWIWGWGRSLPRQEYCPESLLTATYVGHLTFCTQIFPKPSRTTWHLHQWESLVKKKKKKKEFTLLEVWEATVYQWERGQSDSVASFHLALNTGNPCSQNVLCAKMWRSH